MARKKQTERSSHPSDAKAYIEHAGEVIDQKITSTLEKKLYALCDERHRV